MRHSALRFFLLLASLTAVVGAVTALTPASALAGPCGGAVPCACGDEVTSSRTLVPGVDPITFTICPGPGLVITTDDVDLDLGGANIRGSGVAAGIEIREAERVSVLRGRVTGFRTGIRGAGATNGHVADIQVFDNLGAGMTFGPSTGPPPKASAGNRIEKCSVKRNGAGVSMVGDGNLVSLCQIESNGGTGLSMNGDDNEIRRNIVNRNGFGGPGVDGIHIDGSGAIADRNQAKFNAGEGFLVEGNDHTLTLNIATSNGTDGYTVAAINSRFERNIANSNGRPDRTHAADGFGIRDTTTGDGTAGTDNTYAGNACTGNGLGDSSPPGLCK